MTNETIQAKVKGLSNYYTDKAEVYEIDLYLDLPFSKLPFENGKRVSFDFSVNNQNFTCGVRSTTKSGQWISPDLQDKFGKKHRLVDVLQSNGFNRNEKIELIYDSSINQLKIVKI